MVIFRTKFCIFIIFIRISLSFSKGFKSWTPSTKEIVCMKASNFYHSKCFSKWAPLVIRGARQVSIKRGKKKRIQIACKLLTEVLEKCLVYFNNLCSDPYRQNFGLRNEFTSTSFAPAARSSLLQFLNLWKQQGLGRGIEKCEVYGGKCEDPKQLEHCRGESTIQSLIILLICIIMNMILH